MRYLSWIRTPYLPHEFSCRRFDHVDRFISRPLKILNDVATKKEQTFLFNRQEFLHIFCIEHCCRSCTEMTAFIVVFVIFLIHIFIHHQNVGLILSFVAQSHVARQRFYSSFEGGGSEGHQQGAMLSFQEDVLLWCFYLTVDLSGSQIS